MPVAEGKIFSFEDEKSIHSEFLESIDYTGNPQKIKYETDEFSAVCPFSGLPDIAKIEIDYIPDKKIVELKSLKYYFMSYRNVGIYQEAVTDRIYKDLHRILSPKYLSVKTVYNVRGGILATCVMDSDTVK
ncbi:MAG TPA: preQ(1) synthase [Spirochaetota bacterium]|nr:preQ(1) synthase [Spirochaetota bacterium]HPF04910.1 preQ(1) synthase [Spirochaetota bacterium]HPJ40975.1 preQ(1) synthase [Spirochaetota bacterium]HPR37078.1 preQ(1) synthase [Spirochaetota bacterium]HRX46205.1 preQ(1) synthase [Spirochaetota bacterium]